MKIGRIVWRHRTANKKQKGSCMRIKNKVAVTLFCCLLAALSVCEANESTNPTAPAIPSPYPVIDSGVWADAVHSPTIFWLDNQRVIFKGTAATQKANAYKKTELQIWDIEKNKITSYAPTTKGIACYNDGIIFYWAQGDRIGEDRYRYGKLGQEKTTELPKGKKTFIDAMNCRIHNVDTLMKERKSRAVRSLLDRHGYLDLGPLHGIESTSNTPVTFYRQGDSKDILPIKRKSAEIIRYYPFKDAYFIHRIVGGAWVGKAETTWWLSPKGEVTEVNIPHGPWIRGGHVGFYPTRKGIFLVYHGGNKSSKDPGFSGSYLVHDRSATKLIDGHIQDPVVSPDGCKIAFAHYPYLDATRIDDPGRITLKIIDLCMEEKKP